MRMRMRLASMKSQNTLDTSKILHLNETGSVVKRNFMNTFVILGTVASVDQYSISCLFLCYTIAESIMGGCGST